MMEVRERERQVDMMEVRETGRHDGSQREIDR